MGASLWGMGASLWGMGASLWGMGASLWEMGASLCAPTGLDIQSFPFPDFNHQNSTLNRGDFPSVLESHR
jgi:hypothetical protein